MILGLLIAAVVVVIAAASVLIAVEPADALAWVCRRFGFVSLTDAELAERYGLVPGDTAAVAPGTVTAAEVPGADDSLPWVPPTQRVIPDRVIAEGAPPWDPCWSHDTRAEQVLTPQDAISLLPAPAAAQENRSTR